MSIRADDPNPNDLNEGSWVYLASSADQAGHDLRRRLVEVCEASGWPAISSAQSLGADLRTPAAEHEVDSVRHAVAHADVVVALLGGEPDFTERELDFAREHRRPIVVLRGSRDLQWEERADPLRDYDRATVAFCGDADQCGAALRSALTDPGFLATIGEAAAEPSSYG